MNQFSQQPINFQGQQGFQNQSNQFQPIGNVQSHYQGQLSQPTFGRQTNSIVANSPGGYQSYGQGQQQFAPTGFSNQVGANNAYLSHQPVQSYAQSPATAFGSFGPVISHVGFQAGPDSQQQQQQQGRQQAFNQSSNFGLQNAQFAASNFGGFNQAQANVQSGYGPTPTQSYTTSQTPVLDATNTYQQAGPVISHLGGFQATNAQNAPFFGGSR